MLNILGMIEDLTKTVMMNMKKTPTHMKDAENIIQSQDTEIVIITLK